MLIPPDTWFTQEVEAVGDQITIKVNGEDQVVDFTASKDRDKKNYVHPRVLRLSAARPQERRSGLKTWK